MFKKRHNTMIKVCSYGGNTSEVFSRITVCKVDKDTIYFGLTFGRWYQVEPIDAQMTMHGVQQEKYLLIDAFLNDSKALTQRLQLTNNIWIIKS